MTEKEDLSRYKYIGFQVFPGKVKNFWRSAEEEKTYREKLEKEQPGLAFERDVSYIYTPVISGIERAILIGASLLIIVSFFLPWFSATVLSTNQTATTHSVNAIGFFTLLPFLGSLGEWGTGLEIPALVVMTAYMVIPLILSVIFLVFLFGFGKNPEKFYSKIKGISRLFFIPAILWVATIIISAIGFAMPFGDLGIKQFETGFNIISFLSITNLGFYLTLAGSLLCSLMALEL